MRIQTITSLSLTDHWNGVIPHKVAKRQGELDGACGPYALMNALLLSGVLTEKQVHKLWEPGINFNRRLVLACAFVSHAGPLKSLDALPPEHLMYGPATATVISQKLN